MMTIKTLTTVDGMVFEADGSVHIYHVPEDGAGMYYVDTRGMRGPCSSGVVSRTVIPARWVTSIHYVPTADADYIAQ
jgi:hypothetical protein